MPSIAVKTEAPKTAPAKASRAPEGASRRPAGNRAIGRAMAAAAAECTPSAARQAVAGARAGRFPFGDRIAAETGGRIDPHKVPSTVVDGMPGMGVCHGGLVALRRDAPIEIARHELAHALGGGEAIAHRAQRDASVLRGLSGPPVDGWAVGFEFQTVGSKNPKVYVPKADGWEIAPKNTCGANDPIYLGPTYKIEQDHHDIEVIIEPPLPETREGRKQLIKVMDDVTAHMADIAARGMGGPDEDPNYYTNLDVPGAGPVSTRVPTRKLESLRTKMQAAQAAAAADAGRAGAYETARAKFEAEEEHVRGARAYARRLAMKWGVRTQQDPFTAHPQATMGVRFEKLTTMLHELSRRDKDRSAEAETIGWGDHSKTTKAAGGTQGSTEAALKAVKKALGDKAGDPQYARLQSLLSLVAHYAAAGAKMRGKLSYLKDAAPLMSRVSLVSMARSLTDEERAELRSMVAGGADGRLRTAFRAGSEEVLARKTLAGRVAGASEAAVAALNPVTILKGLARDTPVDLITAGSVESLHRLHGDEGDGDTYLYSGMAGPADIGEGEFGPRPEAGLLLEFRRMGHDVPYTRWKEVALAMFDLTVFVNQGATMRDYVRKEKVFKGRSVATPPKHIATLTKMHSLARATGLTPYGP
ncbi:MAG: hypothetical protein KC620_13180 [Myxococcales bacterium]|nr:hypothetical protein [Myxococcales bacterium]